MTLSEQEKKQKQLSQAIDALNKGGSYPSDPETEELVEVARLIQTSGITDAASKQLMAATVEELAAELSRGRRKRRYIWGFSGVAGAVAAVWMLAILNSALFMADDPNRSYTQGSPDLTKVVQIQREQTPAGEIAPPAGTAPKQAAAPDHNKPVAVPEKNAVKPEPAPAPAAENKQTAETRVAVKQQPAAADDKPVALMAEQKTLALKGQQARSKTVDAATGEIRQVYSTAAGEVTLVQPGKGKPAGEIVDTASKSTAMARTASPKTPAVNKVTVTVDGIEATVEGEQPEAELQKIADTIVKQ